MDTDRLASALEEWAIEAVMHLAAKAIVPESVREPAEYWRVNTVGTHCVLGAMRKAGVDLLLFSSTAATYDFSSPMPLWEDSPQRPENPYGHSKLAAERMIADYGSAYGVKSVILRYFNAAGADLDGQHGESRAVETHLIPRIFRVVLGHESRLEVYGGDWDTPDGSCVRDYVHVQDLARAHLLALEGLRQGATGVYNVGSGEGTSVLGIIDAVERVTGRTVPYEVVSRRAGDPPVLVASPQKLTRELGWTPELGDVTPIVETAWRWHEGHPHGYA